MAFKLELWNHISFATDLQTLVSLVAIDSEACQRSFQTFAHRHLKSLCCFSQEQPNLPKFANRLSDRSTEVVNLDLLLCTGFNSEHVFFFLCLFLLRDQ